MCCSKLDSILVRRRLGTLTASAMRGRMEIVINWRSHSGPHYLCYFHSGWNYHCPVADETLGFVPLSCAWPSSCSTFLLLSFNSHPGWSRAVRSRCAGSTQVRSGERDVFFSGTGCCLMPSLPAYVRGLCLRRHAQACRRRVIGWYGMSR